MNLRWLPRFSSLPVFPRTLRDILVIGASGLLGQHLMREATARGDRPVGTYAGNPVEGLLPLDLSDLEGIGPRIVETRPSIVALAGAMTNVDGCESAPDLAARINALAPGRVAEACRTVGARLVHFSTDYVFDGRTGPSDEEGTPNPISVYGRSKLDGERLVLAALPSALVIRSCANFGWNRLRSKENNVTMIVNRLRRKEPVSLFADQWVSPSYVPHVARVAFDLLDRGASGVFHVATRGCYTRLEVGAAVADVFGLPRELLRPTAMAQAKLVAPRPARSCLASKRLERFPDIPVPTFRAALEDMRRSE